MSNAFRPPTRSRRTSSRRPPLYAVPARANPVRSTRPPTRLAQAAQRPRANQSAIRRLPLSRPMPLWLRWLIGLQRGSLIIVFLLAIATLVVYSGTVYTQHLWSTEYRKLKTLQRSEREITAAGETMRNYIARQAERPGSGLITKTPDTTIFLQPAPKGQAPVVRPSIPESEPQSNKSLGY